MDEVKLIMAVAEDFSLEKAVCNHGFFMMAPNKWNPSNKSLVRPFQLLNTNNKSVFTVSISQPPKKHFLIITLLLLKHQKQQLSSQDRQSIRCQVARMLHISAKDEMMVKEFHKVDPRAKEQGFARIFRSPTLFEDIVKSVLLCCCPSLDMAEALCNLEHKLWCNGKKAKRSCKCAGKFPSPKEIAACLDEETLNKHCNLGYRASIILELAKNIQNGSLNLDDFETTTATSNEYDDHKLMLRHRARLMKIKGFGPFIVSNIMMCIGFYQHIPVDTETIKHLEQVHGRTSINCSKIQAEVIAQIYDKYAPFQCLAYWMERLEYYEKKLGKLSQLPQSKYCNVSSTNFQIRTSGNQE